LNSVKVALKTAKQSCNERIIQLILTNLFGENYEFKRVLFLQ